MMVSHGIHSTDVGAWERQKRRRDREPLLYCKLVTKWPVRSFALAFAANILMVATTAILFASGYDIVPISFDSVPLYLIEQPYDARWYAWSSRDNTPDHYDRTSTVLYRTQASILASITLIYDAGEGDDSNVFNKPALLRIREIEDDLLDANGFREYCQLNSEGSDCAPFKSILRYFDGTYSAVNGIFNDPNFDNIQSVLTEASSNNATKAEFQFFVGLSSSGSSTLIKSRLTRTRVSLGFPLKGYDGESNEFLLKLQAYSRENIKDILEKYRESDDVFTFSYYSVALWREDTLIQALKDIRWAAVSLCFIFLVILFHTRSVFITFLSVFGIIVCFATGNLIYNLVLGYRYIGLFHILTIFIILGIGADNIFVFFDIWRLSAVDDYISLAHRLSDCYRKSIGSMLFTSLTTAVAFLSSAITPLLATRSFGIFAAIVVMVNFLSVCLYFPTVVIMYHTYFERRPLICVYVFNKIFKRRKTGETRNGSFDEAPERGRDFQTTSNGFITTQDRQVGDNFSVTTLDEDEVESHDNRAFSSDQKMDISNAGLMQFWNAHKAMYTLNPHAVFANQQNYVQNLSPAYSSDGVSYTWRREDYDMKRNSYNSDRTIRDSSDDVRLKLNASGIAHNEPFYFDGEHVRKERHTRHDRKVAVQNGNVVTAAEFPQRKSTRRKEARLSDKQPLTVRFFRNQYFLFVTHKYIRWIILLVFAGILAFFIYEASRLEPDKELFNIWPDDHVYSVADKHQKYSFSKGSDDQTLTVYFVLGLLANDLSGCSLKTATCEGDRVHGAFDPNSVDAQKALKSLCSRLKELPTADASRLQLKQDQYGNYKMFCFVDTLEAFLKNDPRLSQGNWSLPFDDAKVRSFMASRPDIYNVTALDPGFDRYLQIPVSYWLTNGYTYRQTPESFRYSPLIGESKGPLSSSIVNDPDRLYGNNIKYIAIEIQTTINFRTLGYQLGKPYLDAWDEFVESELSKLPPGVNMGFQIDKQRLWNWLIIQELLVDNAIYGIAIGVSLALLIFIIATGNIITGAIATLSVCGSTVCVVGVIPLGGWKLGVLEALNMCMIVGLTVDYVLHLAEGYTHSLHLDRLSRVRDMLGEMAVPVVFGAFTSLGAAAFMFIATLRFFFQFALFLFSTLGFSLLFSLGMFTILMGIIGPQNDIGNIWVLIKRCYKKVRRRNYT